jgi:hypothetical protein
MEERPISEEEMKDLIFLDGEVTRGDTNLYLFKDATSKVEYQDAKNIFENMLQRMAKQENTRLRKWCDGDWSVLSSGIYDVNVRLFDRSDIDGEYYSNLSKIGGAYFTVRRSLRPLGL